MVSLQGLSLMSLTRRAATSNFAVVSFKLHICTDVLSASCTHSTRAFASLATVTWVLAPVMFCSCCGQISLAAFMSLPAVTSIADASLAQVVLLTKPVVAACVQVFCIQFYLGTTRLQLEHKGDVLHHYTNFANIIVSFGFVVIPVIGWLLDHKGYGITLGTINCIGVICSVLQAIPSLRLQVRPESSSMTQAAFLLQP